MYEFGAEKCIGNIKGGKGDSGQDFKILDFFETVQALSEAIPNPSVGDAYGIGSEAPYDIYIYSQSHGWVNSGTLQPDINEQAPRYEDATTLEPLASGEKISIAFGKIKKAISSLISHIGNTSNPHKLTANSLLVKSIGVGTNIPENSDLDSYTTVGNYVCSLTATALSLSNCPSRGAFTMTVGYATGSSAYLYQEITHFSTGVKYYRTYTASTAEWSEWRTTYSTSNKPTLSDICNIEDYTNKIVTGAYTGDGTVSRKISLEFTPDIVLVFGKSGMVSFLTPENGYRGCGGMAFKDNPCKVGDTSTIEIVDGGFEVSYIAPNGDSTVNVPMSNESNAQYYYMAIRKPIK